MGARKRRIAELEAALVPFASFGEDNVDEEGWNGLEQRASITTWFGPSDFRAARDALRKDAPGRKARRKGK